MVSCGVLLVGAALGACTVPKRVVLDNLVPLVWAALDAAEVFEDVEVHVVILHDDAERADDAALECVAVCFAVCRECEVLYCGVFLEARWGKVAASS